LITDAGLNDLGTNKVITGRSNYCGVGTGATAPSTSDTALALPTGLRSGLKTALQSGVINTTTLPYTSMCQWQYTFAIGSVSGNLSEIGLDVGCNISKETVVDNCSKSDI
jgi:hypothetical protein